MKLSEEAKTKLRSIIEEETKKVPEGQRIKLDTELLDELIFFYGEAKFEEEKQWHTFKVPIWTGDFLSKIDLSELSFKDVVSESLELFSNIRELSEDTEERLKCFKIKSHSEYRGDYEVEDAEFPYIVDDDNLLSNIQKPFVNFSNTNIKLDISDFYANYSLYGWDLSGVDLSKSNLELLDSIWACNLSNTNIQAKDIRFLGTREGEDYVVTTMSYNDFSNNDLSEICYYTQEMRVYDSTKKDDNNNLAYDAVLHNNFSNTGIKIIYDDRLFSYREKLCVASSVDAAFEKEYLVGCYFNGVLVKEGQKLDDVLSELEDKNTFNRQREEQLISSLPSIIEKQLKKAKITEDTYDKFAGSKSEEIAGHSSDDDKYTDIASKIDEYRKKSFGSDIAPGVDYSTLTEPSVSTDQLYDEIDSRRNLSEAGDESFANPIDEHRNDKNYRYPFVPETSKNSSPLSLSDIDSAAKKTYAEMKEKEYKEAVNNGTATDEMRQAVIDARKASEKAEVNLRKAEEAHERLVGSGSVRSNYETKLTSINPDKMAELIDRKRKDTTGPSIDYSSLTEPSVLTDQLYDEIDSRRNLSEAGDESFANPIDEHRNDKNYKYPGEEGTGKHI